MSIQKHRLRLRAKRDSAGPCFYCKVRKANTIDHKIAKRNGGTNHQSNLVFCCDICNREKGSWISFELFSRFSRRFGPVQTGWRKTTNKAKIHAISIILSKPDIPEEKKMIFIEKFGEKIIQRAKYQVDKSEIIR